MFAIAAMSRNRVIGNGGGIPWRIADEHRWFRRTTMGGIVVMGRRTFESLPGPLDGRTNVVLTRDPARFLEQEQRRGRLRDGVVGPAEAPGAVQLTFPRAEVRLVRSLDDILTRSEQFDNIFVLGDATNLPSSKAGSVAHFQADILTENFLSTIDGRKPEAQFDGHANCFIESGFGKGILIDRRDIRLRIT